MVSNQVRERLLPDTGYLKIMGKKKRLAQGIRKYIRRQKMIIKRMAKDKDEESHLVKELLNRFYGPQ